MIKKMWKLLKLVLTYHKLYLYLIIITNLLLIGLNVEFNKFRAFFISSFEHKNSHEFIHSMFIFCILATCYILISGYNSFWRTKLSYVWRERLYTFLGNKLLLNWKLSKNISVLEQKLTQDLSEFSDLILSISNDMFNSVIKLPIFAYLLVKVSSLWVLLGAFIWAIIGFVLASRIAKPLVQLNYIQETREADLRRQLIINVVETNKSLPTLKFIAENWYALANRAKKLGFFQNGFAQISIIIPYLLLSPTYFLGTITLGVLWSAADAFKTVFESLDYLIENRDSLSKLEAVVNRVNELY